MDSTGHDSGSGVRNVVSGAVSGPVVQAGRIDVVNVVGAGVVRARYREQVRQIAPRTLVARDAELAELARFCTTPEVPSSYLWWQAPAWAGKSALLSWFVLHPPAGVQIVSFFITARFAGNDTRAAFVTHVLEQAAALLDQSVPPLLAEHNREAHLLGMLAEAAQQCRDAGQRLVLVVDGLDEDRSLAAGEPGSIAALLPSQPSNGSRVIVAGRPHPMPPTDVGDDHPLRHPDIVRLLAVSGAATMIRSAMERELDALLAGSSEEQDLVGLLVAAGGGLGSRDLAELMGWSPRRVEARLNSAAGRSFTRRPGAWRPGEVYVLGHEELQASVVEELGEIRLRDYRQRIREWASQYRHQHWPANTPEYLLRGYFRILHAHDEVTEMVALATDTARHDRLRALSGGDLAALGEIAAAQQLLHSQSEPDLLSLIRLAIHHEHLTERNVYTPTSLPALWARLGDVDRAEASAEAIPSPRRSGEALARVVETLVYDGHPRRAEDVARRLVDPRRRDLVMASLVGALAMTGDTERAEGLVPLITDPNLQADAVGDLVLAVGRAGDLPRAESLAHTIITDSRVWRHPLTALAAVYVEAGDAEQATRVAAEVDAFWQPLPMVTVIRMLVHRGEVERAETLVDPIDTPAGRALALAELVRTLGATGAVEQAEALAAKWAGPDTDHEIAAALAETVGGVGDIERARALIDAIPEGQTKDHALLRLIEALCAAGNVDGAEAFAHTLAGSHLYLDAATAVITRRGAAGEVDRAREFIRTIDEDTPPSPAPKTAIQAEALTALAEAVANAGDLSQARDLAEQAATLAGAARHSRHIQRAVTVLGDLAAQAGDVRRGEALARLAIDAHHTARADPIASMFDSSSDLLDPTAGPRARAALPRLLSTHGDLDLAETLARNTLRPADQVDTLTNLALRARNAGDQGRAHRLAEYAASHLLSTGYLNAPASAWIGVIVAAGELDRAQALTDTIHNKSERLKAVLIVIRALATAAAIVQARQLIETLTNEDDQRHAVVVLIGAMGAAGDVTGAQTLAVEMLPAGRRNGAITALAVATAASGDIDRAETLADMIGEDADRAKVLRAIAAHADTPTRRRLLATALPMDHWTSLLSEATPNEYADLLTLIDDITAHQRQAHSENPAKHGSREGRGEPDGRREGSAQRPGC